ncbi:MAG TPA: hypothetical protein VJV23_03605 [Candidatus Polarisedimenticolia bacterium]|nr:hypothetical protein [Candidatus Polarisedimenticolia bacterium]
MSPEVNWIPERRHEERDVSPRILVWSALAYVGLGLASMLIVAWLFFSFFPEGRRGEPLGASRPLPAGLPPSPRLQLYPPADLEELRLREEAVLTSYGWVDRPAGVARMPIERAMEIVAREAAR